MITFKSFMVAYFWYILNYCWADTIRVWYSLAALQHCFMALYWSPRGRY